MIKKSDDAICIASDDIEHAISIKQEVRNRDMKLLYVLRNYYEFEGVLL